MHNNTWITKKLSSLLDTEIDDYTANYILEMESQDIIKDYLSNILDIKDEKVVQFIDIVIQIWENKHTQNPDLKLNDFDEPVPFEIKNEINSNIKSEVKKSNETNNRKKITFSPLFSNNVSIIPGRFSCNCQASTHDLINNCSNCGRVVCSQEGAGPCYFCSNLVCSKEQGEFISTGSKKAMKLKSSLMKGAAIQKALENRDKLVDYDKNTISRTKIFDDECDHYGDQRKKWMSKEERKLLEDKEEKIRNERFASRMKQKVTLRFDGKQDIPQKPINVYDLDDEPTEKNNQIYSNDNYKKLKHNEKPMFIDDINERVSKLLQKNIDFCKELQCKEKEHKIILQDAHIMDMTDNGMCLSMHQPWATLLVKGIKIHEGRSWNSSHRGILWIASTAKEPSCEDMEQVLAPYRSNNIELPTQYPTGVLLGYVNVENVICKEEYRNKYPKGESSCDFVFICSSPKELIIKHQMKGMHKIC